MNRTKKESIHSLWLHDVRSALNVGSMFRIADALGIKEVILSGFTPVPPSEKIAKTALGAEKTVQWSQFKKPEEVFEYLRRLDYQLIALEQTTTSIPLQEVRINSSLTSGFCLVAGSETVGVSDEILRASNLHVHIDQVGEKHSLNISVAVGIALFYLQSECI